MAPLFLSAVTIYAQSQGPTPRPLKACDKPQKHATASHNISGPTQITILGETKITPGTNQQNSDGKTSSDWRIVFFTGCLVLIGAFQLFMFRKQLKMMRQGVIDASIAANAAKEAADAARKSAEVLPKIERAYLFVELEY
ncbi:MAG: hypothetical protein ABSB94_07040 [Syntrophorhabdales bacterium]|jgi:hypothetical protein